MFDLISSIYHDNKEFIHGVASTISIFSAVLWFLGRNERKKKKLYFQWIRKDRVLTDLPAGFSVSVSKGDLNGRSLVTDAITLVNNTDVIIKDEDFAKPIEIYKKNTNTIFLMNTIDSNNGSHATLIERNDAIALSDVYLPRGASLTIYLAHDNVFPKELRGDLKNLPNLESKRFVPPSETWQLQTVFVALSIAAYFAIFYAVYATVVAAPAGSGNRLQIELFLMLATVAVIPLATVYFPRKLDRYLRGLLGISREEYFISSKNVIIECEAKLGADEQTQKAR
ncbi:hypothetical protein [Ruegeria arenilitoris]|uniref:hypothetical protein n=1 Tax=Ruegeria arenilitoris TaxID=1173585 RepID=UPI00147CE804|nr:hypothetical protein [Ruegeria arenilitoris]